jgi:hypothetical protein
MLCGLRNYNSPGTRIASAPDTAGGQIDRLYLQRGRPLVMKMFPVTELTRGIHETLDAGANHFHAGVLLLIADLLQRGEEWTVGAAITEYGWAVLIVVDDVADRQSVRRGYPTFWKTAGVSYARAISSEECQAHLCFLILKTSASSFLRFFRCELPAFSWRYMCLRSPDLRHR